MNNSNKELAIKIRELKDTLPQAVLEKHFEKVPKLKESYTDRHKKLYLEDTCFHMNYLATSIEVGEIILFTEYMNWAKIFFSTLPVSQKDIILNLELLRDAIKVSLSKTEAEIVSKYINKGIRSFKSQAEIASSFILDSNPLKNEAANYLDLLLNGNRKDALSIVNKALDKGSTIKDIYMNIFEVTQKETGRLWQLNKISVAQEHLITASTQLIMSHFIHYLFTATNKKKKIIVSCIAGELHELGARMVADFFEMDGWDSYYLGANTPLDSLIKAIIDYKPDILAISATMAYNLNAVGKLIKNVRENNATNYIKILVGGYPFSITGKMWKNMGADGCALNAGHAIQLAQSLIK